jgi:hypothetical protein
MRLVPREVVEHQGEDRAGLDLLRHQLSDPRPQATVQPDQSLQLRRVAGV